MKSRVVILLERNYPVALAREQRRGCAAGGAAPDYSDITLLVQVTLYICL
jgi:hypothetical protein